MRNALASKAGGSPKRRLLASLAHAWPALLAAIGLAAGRPCPAADRQLDSGADWPGYGGSDENHYSPLDQINDSNVSRLGLVWYQDIDVAPSSLSAPIAVNGILYFAAGHSVIHALDAASGKQLWRHDPRAWELAGEKMRASWGIRGIAYANGRIFTGTVDGRLIALDAKTGRMVWSTMTVGKDDGRYITGAPWVFEGKVVIGHGGADFAPVRGYVTAYDQATGKQVWRVFTVPGDPAKGFESTAMAMAATTWTGQWWKFGGGGTVWNAMAYDPQFNRIYIGTGNGAPWNQKIRSPGGGDNLFLCSILALDADTGAYIWHYQVNPGETWDYNAAMDIGLADLEIDGKIRPVILHAPKNGFFYVIDRQTGKLISAEAIVPVTWATAIDRTTGRPLENPDARYPGGKPVIVYPSSHGAHGLEAMSFNATTGLVYIPTNDEGRVYADPAGALATWRFPGGQMFSNGLGVPPAGLRPRRPGSALVAWDPVRQTAAWQVPFSGARRGGGTATTRGNLVLQGRATGQFTVLAADSGKPLWSFDAQTAVTAQPISYLAGGRQFISVIAGARFASAIGLDREWNYRTQRWRVLTFALDGKATLPPADYEQPPIVDDDAFRVNPIPAATGAGLFAQRCAICHGQEALSGGAAPDLLRSWIPVDQATFASVVHDGALQRNGMPSFAELSANQLDALRHYLRQRARAASAEQIHGTAAASTKGELQ
jgi:quinohemoprotein ethanol dehydrogenase